MSVTENIKEQLSAVFGEGNWKRILKDRVSSTLEKRVFRNPEGKEVESYTHVESPNITTLYNGEKIIFGITNNEDQLIIRFAEPYLYADGATEHDDNLALIFPYIGKTIPSYLRQQGQEWVCDVGLYSRDMLVADLVAGGFTFDLTFANDLNDEYGGPMYGLPSANETKAGVEAALEEEVYDDFEEREKALWVAADKIHFGVYDSGNTGNPSSDSISVAFAREWHRDTDRIYDGQVTELLEARGIKLPEYLGEDAENSFGVWEDGMSFDHMYPPTLTKAQVVADLTALGLHFNKDMDRFLGGR